MRWIPVIGLPWALKSDRQFSLIVDIWQVFWIMALTYITVGI